VSFDNQSCLIHVFSNHVHCHHSVSPLCSGPRRQRHSFLSPSNRTTKGISSHSLSKDSPTTKVTPYPTRQPCVSCSSRAVKDRQGLYSSHLFRISVSPSPPKVEIDDVIDEETFDQIRELDEDGEFASEMIEAFFEQAIKTFREMDEALCVYLISSSPYLTALLQRKRGLEYPAFSRSFFERLFRCAWRDESKGFVRADPALWPVSRRGTTQRSLGERGACQDQGSAKTGQDGLCSG
jgi:hypothetical protein